MTSPIVPPTRSAPNADPDDVYVGPRALDAKTGDLLVWRYGAYQPAADRDYFPGCKRGLPRLGGAASAGTVAA